MAQQYPQGYYPPQPPAYYPPPTQSSSLAVFSMIAGIGAYFICPGLGALAAIICGHIAKGQIRDSGGRLTGGGMATAGLILGYLQLVLLVLGICLYLLFVIGFFGLVGLAGASSNSY